MRDAGDGCLMTKMMCFERGGIIPRAYAMTIYPFPRFPFSIWMIVGRVSYFLFNFSSFLSPRLRELAFGLAEAWIDCYTNETNVEVKDEMG